MTAALLSTLVGIVGRDHCLGGADRGPFVVEGRTAAGVPVIPWGGGTQMHLGTAPADGAVVVVTRRLARVLEHEPGDLTATVEAGLAIDDLQAVLGTRGQWLSLDPPFPARATLGGVLATNASGPRRYLYGTARDLVIGMRVAGPDGSLVRIDGKVVENVAGYDLVKLYIGSLGTLGLIVEATLKLRPRPEADRACWAAFDSLGAAAAAVSRVMGSDLLPHSLEFLDAGATAACAAALGLPARDGGAAALLIGFDGLERTVAWQVGEAERLLRDAGARGVTPLEDGVAQQAVAFVRDIRAAVPEPLAVARVAVLPKEVGPYAAAAAQAARAAGLRVLTTAHAGSGVLSLVPPGADGAS